MRAIFSGRVTNKRYKWFRPPLKIENFTVSLCLGMRCVLESLSFELVLYIFNLKIFVSSNDTQQKRISVLVSEYVHGWFSLVDSNVY